MNLVSALLGQLILGWLIADLLTGTFHWWEDTHPQLADWPVVGPFIIAPNILHHNDPLAFTKHGFWARNGASMAAAAVASATLIAAFGLHPWIVALAFGAGISNEVHRYAHQPSAAPAWLRPLQQIGIVQSPKEHAAHHRPPQTKNYCVLTDWLNPVLETVNFWHAPASDNPAREVKAQ